MEIFAQINDDTRLVKATKKELMLLLGYTSRYDTGFRDHLLDIGGTIDVEKFAKITNNLKNLHTKLLEEILNKLKLATQNVTEAIDQSNEINCFEKLKGDQ